MGCRGPRTRRRRSPVLALSGGRARAAAIRRHPAIGPGQGRGLNRLPSRLDPRYPPCRARGEFRWKFRLQAGYPRRIRPGNRAQPRGSQTNGLATENAAIAGWIPVPISVLASLKKPRIDPRSWFLKAHTPQNRYCHD